MMFIVLDRQILLNLEFFCQSISQNMREDRSFSGLPLVLVRSRNVMLVLAILQDVKLPDNVVDAKTAEVVSIKTVSVSVSIIMCHDLVKEVLLNLHDALSQASDYTMACCVLYD